MNIKGVDIDARLVRAVFNPGSWLDFGEAGTVYTTRDAGTTDPVAVPGTTFTWRNFIDDDRGWIVGQGPRSFKHLMAARLHKSTLPDTGNAFRFAATVCR